MILKRLILGAAVAAAGTTAAVHVDFEREDAQADSPRAVRAVTTEAVLLKLDPTLVTINTGNLEVAERLGGTPAAENLILRLRFTSGTWDTLSVAASMKYARWFPRLQHSEAW